MYNVHKYDLGISIEGVEKLLNNLNVSKAFRSDMIPCRLLKGLAEEIAPILAEIFRQSLRYGLFRQSGKMQTWPQFLRWPRLFVRIRMVKMPGYSYGTVRIHAGPYG